MLVARVWKSLFLSGYHNLETLLLFSNKRLIKFQVILVASSFMSPLESRNGTNRNAVRIFGADKLSKIVANEKWDRVKVVCTQPFNKVKWNVQFSSVMFLMWTFRTSCYSTRLSWAHTPVINWVVCLGQKVGS